MQKETICSDVEGAHGGHELLAPRLIEGETAHRLADLFKALADPVRVRLIGLLAEAEVCVGDLSIALGMSQPAVSHHLKLLRAWKIVSTRRAGKHIFYSLQDEHVELLYQQALAHVRHD